MPKIAIPIIIAIRNKPRKDDAKLGGRELVPFGWKFARADKMATSTATPVTTIAITKTMIDRMTFRAC